jgi:hypothetical protein
MYGFPENGGILPKHVGVNKEVCLYIRRAYISFVNKLFIHSERNKKLYKVKDVFQREISKGITFLFICDLS